MLVSFLCLNGSRLCLLVQIGQMRVPSAMLKQALAARVLRYGSRHGDSNVGIYSQRDNGALITVVVNRSQVNCQFSLDLKESLGLICTRQAMLTKDVVPGQSVQIVNVALPVTGTWQSKSEYKWICANRPEHHEPGIFSQGLHDPIKLSDITECLSVR